MKYALYNETGRITDVFVHEPGLEVKPAIEMPEAWLFDKSVEGASLEDWLHQAKWEHQQMAEELAQQGIRVHYLTELLESPKAFAALNKKLADAVKLAHERKLVSAESALEFMLDVHHNPIQAALTGMDLTFEEYAKLAEAGFGILIPKPNAYFAQDPFAIIGSHFVQLKPATWQRSGEPILWRIALQPNMYDYAKIHNVCEGGDITLWDNKLWVGVGTRTTEAAAKELAGLCGEFFKDAEMHAVTVYKPDAAADLGLNHTPELPFIHYDTISMPLTKTKAVGNIQLMNSSLAKPSSGTAIVLTDYLKGKGIVPIDESEQYSLAANVLPANGAILSARQNAKTNGRLEQAGFNVKALGLSTLTMGSGAVHCMTNVAVRKSYLEQLDGIGYIAHMGMGK